MLVYDSILKWIFMKMAVKKYLIRTKFQNDFGILKQSIVKVHLFKFFVYSEIVFSRTYIYRLNQQTYTNDSSGYAQHDSQHKIYFLSSFEPFFTPLEG